MGTSFANISDDDLQHIVDLINNRPRKRLGFRTPLEVLYKFFVNFVALDLTIYHYLNSKRFQVVL